MKKQIVLFLMALMPVALMAVEIDGLWYELVSKAKEAKVIGYKGTPYSGDIVIPASVEYEGVAYSVTSIESGAFSNCTGLTSVTIPSSVTSIGGGAFDGSTGLTSITIPSSVTSIGSSAFSNCSGLSSITIPSSVTSIGETAFYGCTGLTSVTIPSSVTSIGNGTFFGCTGLTSVTIPSSVTSIGSNAFYNCTSLTSITIPSSVTSIGESAFMSCTGLTSVTIPSSVTSIGDLAFYNCTSLTSVTIPSSVTSIGGHAFDGCKGLNSVTIHEGVTTIGESAFYGCTGLTSVTIPSSVTSIESGAFSYCTSLTSVTIPSSVTSIDNSAFSGCTSLTSVTIPSSITSIGADAFSHCSSLTSLTIPSSVTSIGESAFAGCNGLTSLTIPSSVTSIGNGTFSGCFGLTSVTIPSSVTSIGADAFSHCSGLTSVTIPSSVTSIGNSAFSYCYGLTSVTIPSSVTSIGNSAFKGCTGLTSVTIPSSVTSIGDYAFSSCTELADVYCYAETVPNTQSNAFDNSYPQLSTLHVPASAIDSYRTTEPWSKFGTIVPISMPSHKLIYVVDGEEISSEEVEDGTAITAKEEPTKEGYTFSGWSEIPETMPDHDVTITGSFTVNSYKLTYVVDGEMYKEIKVEYGADVTPEADLEKEGYTFSGWSEIPATMPAHDVTITGTFTRGAYKLIYTIDGEAYKTYSKDYQDAITAEAAPEREGYTFSGWSEIPETMPAHDVTVTGSFTINQYTLTLKVGDNVYETQTLDYGSAIVVPEMPELTGYTFTWGEVPETMPAGDVTIVGEYKPNYYNVTYLVDGQFYAIVKVQFGSAITTPNVPEREGSTFTWGDYPTTMPAHDIIIEGTYTDGIDLVQSTQNVEIYSLDGKKMNRMQRGVNIVRRGSRSVKVRRD